MEKEMILSASSSIEVRFDDLRSSGSQQTLNNDGNNLVDRISDLPDELLHHILCFLPTKFSFTTTVLSKRWTGLCYSLPVLRFEDETTRYRYDDTFFRFCRMVNTVLLSPRATNQPLKMFRVKCRFEDTNQNGPFNVAKWLEATKQRSVEEVHLSLYYQTLKPNIFIFQTLVVLKLERVIVGKNTSCVDLPSLKTLTLECVYFKNWNDYINFLNACPILEDLNVEYINTFRKNVPEEALKSFTLPKLVRASVDALFYGIDNVEFLTFWFKETSLNVIPMFSNLIHIELVFGNFTYHYWDRVVELLRHSPKLQILYIKKWTKTRSSKEWKCPISVPECVLSNLRSCTVLNFDGSENDLRFAKYILQNASLLQDMTIGVAVGSSDEMPLKINQIREELSSYPRISPKLDEDQIIQGMEMSNFGS